MAEEKATKGSAAMVILFMGVIAAAFVYRPALVMILLAGLLPTFAAWLTDSHKFRDFRVRIMFAINVAGVLPFANDVGTGDRGFEQALEIVTSLQTYMVIYGFALLGTVIVFIAPFIAAFFLNIMANSRIAIINSQQNKLIEKWGRQITGEKVDEPS